MQILSGEQILLESNKYSVVLTTHRIRSEVKGEFSQIDFVSIMLDELVSCSIRQCGKPLLIFIGIALFFISLIISLGIAVEGGGNAFSIGFLGAIIGGGFVLSYFLTRETNLTLASAGDKIYIKIKGANMQNAKQLVDQIEFAKNARYYVR